MRVSLCLVLATAGLLGRIVAAQQTSVSLADIAYQQLTPQQKEVWDRERAYFGYLQSKDLDGFMSLWHERFVGWPDYSEHPVGKSGIRASVAEEFHSDGNPNRPLTVPTPEAVEIFGDVAITHYFWPESRELPGQKIRITHTWLRDRTGWRIIGGMSCDVSSISGVTGLGSVATTAQEPQQKLEMPGPEVQNLMLGTWSTKVHYPPSPATPNGDTGEGTEVWRPGPGGRSVIEEYLEKNSNGEVEGLGVAWWDKQAQGQRFVWCENSNPDGCYVSKEVAKWNGGRLDWKEEQETSGKKRVYSEIFKDISPDSFTQVLQEGEPGEALKDTAVISAKRISSSSISSRRDNDGGQPVSFEPKPNMQKLSDLLAGRWYGTVTTEPGSHERGRADETWRLSPGGLTLVEENRLITPKGDSFDYAAVWWNRKAQKYQGIWCADINDEGCSGFDAQAASDRVTMTGEWEQLGHRRTWREVFSRPEQKSSIQILEVGEPGGELKRVSAITATKVSEGATDSSNGSAETELRAFMAELRKASIEGDMDTIANSMTDDYVQTDINGYRQDKTTWLNEYFKPLANLIKAGNFHWDEYDRKNLQFRFFGNCAVVTGELQAKGTGARFGTQHTWVADPNATLSGTLHFTHVYIKRNGRWILAALHNQTPLPPANASK